MSEREYKTAFVDDRMVIVTRLGEELETTIVCNRLNGQAAHITALEAELAEAKDKYDRLRQACIRDESDIQQTLGKVLGYPWFKDDQKNFPGASEENGVCVGEHVAVTLAMQAAKQLTAALATVEKCKQAGFITKDGNIAVSGMVYHPDYTECGAVEMHSENGKVRWYAEFYDRNLISRYVPVSDCYSTPSAAAAAKGGGE